MSRCSPDDPLKEGSQTSDLKSDGKINVDNDLCNRVSEMEFQIENILKGKKLEDDIKEEIKNYLVNVQEDIKSIKSTRKCTVWGSLFYIIFLNLLFVYIIFFHKDFYLEIGSYGQACIVIFIISSSVILIGAILRGSFRTYGERHKYDYMPPHLKEILKTFKPSGEN